MRITGYFGLRYVIEAPTMEAAEEAIDNAIDFSKLKERGIRIVGFDQNMSEEQPSLMNHAGRGPAIHG